MTAKVEDNELKAGDKVMLKYGAAYKYETPYTSPFVITQCVDKWHGHIFVWCDKNEVLYTSH